MTHLGRAPSKFPEFPGRSTESSAPEPSPQAKRHLQTHRVLALVCTASYQRMEKQSDPFSQKREAHGKGATGWFAGVMLGMLLLLYDCFCFLTLCCFITVTSLHISLCCSSISTSLNYFAAIIMVPSIAHYDGVQKSREVLMVMLGVAVASLFLTGVDSVSLFLITIIIWISNVALGLDGIAGDAKGQRFPNIPTGWSKSSLPRTNQRRPHFLRRWATLQVSCLENHGNPRV